MTAEFTRPSGGAPADRSAARREDYWLEYWYTWAKMSYSHGTLGAG